VEYTVDLISEVIANRELIEAFLERTTSELFTVHYVHTNPWDDYFQEPGHTLENDLPHTTRVPNKDSLRENLMVILADIDRALKILTLEERLAVIYYLTLYQGRKGGKSAAAAHEALVKMTTYLNNGN
jgi:hypothetical protein